VQALHERFHLRNATSFSEWANELDATLSDNDANGTCQHPNRVVLFILFLEIIDSHGSQIDQNDDDHREKGKDKKPCNLVTIEAAHFGNNYKPIIIL
jgi:hypothetical protein